jgi:transposase
MPLPVADRWKIIHTWLQAEESSRGNRTIARRCGVSHPTAAHWIRVYQETGGVEDKPRSGRPRKSSSRQDTTLHKIVNSNPTLTSRQIAAAWKKRSRVKVSKDTVKRRLHELGIRSRTARRSAIVSERNRKKRVKWAKEHIEWSPYQWNRVLFSDETGFSLGYNTRSRMWVREGKKEVMRHQVGIPHEKGKINVWACFSSRGVGEIAIYRESTTAEVYLSILEEHLLPSASKLFKDYWRFLQDNLPSHTAKSVKKWMTHHCIRQLELPAESPDLNPIENLWSLLKRRVYQQQPESWAQLETIIRQEWRKLTPCELEPFVNSMINRCKMVVEAEGHRILY